MPGITIPIPFGPTTPYTTILRGDVSPQLKLQKSKFDPIRGYTFFYDYDGQDQGQMFAIQLTCNAAGLSSELTFERDRAVLNIIDATSEFTIDSWEVHASEETRDLFSHPFIVAAIGNSIGYGNASIDAFATIRTYAENPTATSRTEMLLSPTLTGLSTAAVLLLVTFYNLFVQGTTGYRHQQYVLKHRTNVSNRWNVNVADVGIDQIYTPAQFFTEVTDPTLWIFPMPGRLQFKLANIPVPFLGGYNTNDYLWGWLKSSSTETSEALNRVNIETDYTLELWSLALYNPYGSSDTYIPYGNHS
jgi:hypothetical protein